MRLLSLFKNVRQMHFESDVELLTDRKLPKGGPARIALIYAALSATWILLSDGAVGLIASDAKQAATIGAIKGWVFVVLTTLILLGLMKRMVHNLSTLLRENEAAKAELAIAATAFDSQEGMAITDRDGVILRVNRAFTEITGYTSEEAVGQTPRVLKSGRHEAAFYNSMWESLDRAGIWQGEVWNRRKNGEEYLAWLTISAVKNKECEVVNYVGTQFDITEQKKADEKIIELAFYDQLTGLPNRTLALDRLNQSMTGSFRNGCYNALLFLDLDDFKTLNETLGHEMGDVLLQQAAQRLIESVREGDTVARLGGDEFLVMLIGLSTDQTDAATQVEIIAKKLLAAFSRPYLLNETRYHCTSSIGASLFKGHSTTVDELLRQADLAMYRSKATGGNAICFFDNGMQSAIMGRATLEADLRRGIEEKQFTLNYQPQVLSDGHLIGAEALVRWRHPARGLVSPAEFIPLAEDTGLILPLGEWVLETACAQLVVWADKPNLSHFSLAVNVSARQFRQTDFVDRVLNVISRTGVNPCRLKIELTESMLVENLQDIIEKMSALKSKGVSFSLDDFGTGYSSLSYLKRLPLDQLKIDQSFVRDVLTDPNDAAIAKTIVALAQSLQLGVIAEGVETEEQKVFLENSGCHSYQGYFFSRPLPLDAFEEFARRG